MKRALPLAAAALLGAACASTPPLITPANDLERSIHYQEATGYAVYEISGSSFEVRGIPNGSSVDMDSSLEIEVRKDSLHLPQGLMSPSEVAARLAATDRLLAALGVLAADYEAEAKAIESRSPPPPRAKPDGAALQRGLDESSAAFEKDRERVLRRAPRLSISAYLERGKGDPTRLHLPNYDFIDRREPGSLSHPMLDTVEWDSFLSLHRRQIELSEAVAGVRRAEARLGAALRESPASGRSPPGLELTLTAPALEWADLPRTRLDLPRAPRSMGDRVHVLARLNLGDEALMSSKAIFTLDLFGRHSFLAPSVVLVRPVSANAENQNFKFAPAVAWLHTYLPRTAEGGTRNSLLRFSQASIGLHAAFVDLDPNIDNEIGLGFATSIWKDRIVAGIGWDLMANSKVYFFIGTNLIPILQGLGYGETAPGGPAVKQP